MTAIDVAESVNMVDKVHRIDRGYERIEGECARRGARICRVPA